MELYGIVLYRLLNRREFRSQVISLDSTSTNYWLECYLDVRHCQRI